MKSYIISLKNFVILLAGIVMLTSFSVPEEKNKASNGGEMTFTVRTVTANGNFSPKHVLAIWVESNDVFVKTRKAMANQRIQYLYTWGASSNFNTVDAITGPTLTSHQTHTVTWDCTDLAGDIVPDGDYVVYTEFTDKHAQGPLYSITFTKGPDSQTLSPPDETYFKDIELTFTPIVCDFSANETEICQEEVVTFTDESINASSWSWDFGEGAVPSTASSQGPHTVTYSSTGIKTVTLTINGNLTETKEGYINVSTQPTADYMFGGSNLMVEFTNNSTNATTYLWDFGDGNTSTEDNPVHTYAIAGVYQVSLSASQLDCIDDIVQEVMVPLVGLVENNLVEDFKIYPNPSSDIAHLHFTIHDSQFTDIELFTVEGRKIRDLANGIMIPGTHDIRVDVSDLPAGIYYVRIQTGDVIDGVKLVVMD